MESTSVFGGVDRLPGGMGWRAWHPVPGGGMAERLFPECDRAAAGVWLEHERFLAQLGGMAGGLVFPQAPGVAAPLALPVQGAAFVTEGRVGVLFADYAHAWLREYRRRDGREARGATLRNVRADVAHLVDRFGGMDVASIGRRELHAWYNAQHPEGPWSFERQCMRMKAILSNAARGGVGEWGRLIAESPWDLPVPSGPEGAREDVTPLTALELRRIYEGMPAYDRISVYLAALCGGLRIGEVCGLMRADVDLEARTLHVAHSVNRGKDDVGRCRLCPPKTRRSDRVVSVPDVFVPLLRDHMDRWARPGDPMLIQPRRSQVMSPTTLQKHFHTAAIRAGREDVTFHVLRATHATLLFMNGGTLRECMDDLGHVSERVAVRHYQRVVPGHRRDVNDILARKLLDRPAAPADE